jgi:flagellar hook-associated protein 2
MSTTSSSGIYFSGLSSGIDTDSIISKLMEIEKTQVTRLQTKQTDIATRQAALLSLKTQVATLSTASAALNSSTAFSAVTATSSNTAVASVTATNSASAGTFNLAVSKLALAHKVGSTSISNATTALGWSAGTFVVNGKGVSVDSTDSLTSIASKINSADAGVTASVINGGTNNSYLTLTSTTTGADSKIQIADLSGSTIASNLGLLSGTTSYRETIDGGVTSIGLTSSNTALSSLFGTSSVGTKTINLNGTDIAIDFDTATLADVANAINTSGAGVSASVRTDKNSSGDTVYKLDLKGVTSYTDSDKGLQALGVVQQSYASEISSAQDAEYSIDNIAMTSSTNEISTVIPGVTLTLLTANQTTPVTSTISLARDTATTLTKVKTFVQAYNAVQSFITTNSALDTSTYETGVLFGDSVAQQVENQLSDMVLNNVEGLDSKYTNMMALGISMGTDGTLTLDESAFTTALNSDADAVGKVFRASGTGSSDAITYVSNTSKTIGSGSSPYVIGVTQLATKGSYTGAVSQTSASTATETLTFTGTGFGSTPYTLNLEIGSTLSTTISKINTDATLKDLVTAVDDGGTLKIISKKYGTSGNFSVCSSLSAAADNSGIGTSGEGTLLDGVNIAGTINGEAATGSGQFLTGVEGNSTTSGLQIEYTGTTTGSNVGTISFAKGIGSRLFDLISTYTDSVNGLFTTTDAELTTQTNELSDQITALDDQLATKEQELRDKFSAMETAMENLKTQQAQLNAMLGIDSSSSS